MSVFDFHDLVVPASSGANCTQGEPSAALQEEEEEQDDGTVDICTFLDNQQYEKGQSKASKEGDAANNRGNHTPINFSGITTPQRAAPTAK